MRPKETIGFGRQQNFLCETIERSGVLSRFRHWIGAVLLGSFLGLSACAVPAQISQPQLLSAKSKNSTPKAKINKKKKGAKPVESAPMPKSEEPTPKAEESSAPAPAPSTFPKFNNIEECVDEGYCDYA